MLLNLYSNSYLFEGGIKKRLIDADEAKRMIDHSDLRSSQKLALLSVISSCKAVDPTKHAHVIVDFDGGTKCSGCGQEYIDSTMPYCANCGARFDEPEIREL